MSVDTKKVNVYAEITEITGWAKNVSYCTLFISSLNIDQFSQFFTSRLCKKFATQGHAHRTYYIYIYIYIYIYVTTLPCKI